MIIQQKSSKETRVTEINCIFIDHDNTLIDLEFVLERKLDGLFSLSGEEVTDILLTEIHDGIIHTEFQDKHSDISFHSRLLLDRLGVSYNQDFADKVTGRIKEAFNACLEIPIFFPDSLSFLDNVTEYGFKLYLTTANFACKKVEALEKYGGRKYFVSGYDEIAISQRKLDPAFYKEALDRSCYSASETVVIGDSLFDDIFPAKDAGITTIWLNRNGINIVDRRKADFEVSNLMEAVVLLKEINKNNHRSIPFSRGLSLKGLARKKVFFQKGGV